MSSMDDDSAEVETPEPATTGVSKRTRRATTSGLPPKPKKKYSKRVEVWQYFIVRADDPKTADCNYCNSLIGCDSKVNGTSPMKTHIARCKAFLDSEQKDKQKSLCSDNDGNMKMMKYDPQVFKRSVNKMVVVNELAFSLVESEGWRRFCLNVLLTYQTFSRRTCGRDIVAMYLEEKEALKTLFTSEQRRVSFTTDIWTSPATSYTYMVVTDYWIDSNWKLQRRILGFKMITDHRGETIAGQLKDCLEEWGIRKVFTVTVDNARSNDRALKVFKDYLTQLGSDTLVIGGELHHMRCCAHIFNLIVGDGIKKSKHSVVAIRNAIKYVRPSFSRLKSFELRCESGKITRGSLPLDVITRWNSTYLMLSAAVKLRGAFENMEAKDKLYCEYFLEEEENKVKRIRPPTESDWDDVQRLVKFLKIFYNSTVTFSASKSVIATLCYNEIVNIERNLIAKCESKSEEIKKEAHVMRDKFEKYWDGLMNMNPLIIIGSVFDPRNKMQFTCLCFEQLSGKNTIENMKLHANVLSVLRRLYAQYSERLTKPDEVQASDGDLEMHTTSTFDVSDGDKMVEAAYIMFNKMVHSSRNDDGFTELDIYLTEKMRLK